ncbi:hypothetical protein [Roseixanthobacter liquoris]|uniref:hypothetical protein n=1 Tax=Roseixanthobacter liquoris TaxID=3119921 RepID=UPI0037286E67
MQALLMIFSSIPWKEGLLKDAKKLEKLQIKTESSFISFEKMIFVSALAIRKLIESHKLTDRTIKSQILCTRYKIINPTSVPDILNGHNFNVFYDIKNGSEINLSIKSFVNKIIHSFILIPEVRDEISNQLSGFFVNSDFDKSKFLDYFALPEIIRIMRLIGNDEVIEAVFERSKDGSMKVINFGPDDIQH